MKGFLLGFLAAAVIAGSAFYFHSHHKHTNPVKMERNDDIPTWVYDSYVHWKNKFGRIYGSQDEDSYRAQVFYSNFLKIQEHNSHTEYTFTLGINQFMDYTPEEFTAYYLSGLIIPNQESQIQAQTEPSNDRPETWDWRTKNAVSAVKNQKSCGSCWAFSSTGALESFHFIQTNTMTTFSEQQLVDCSTSYGNEGCNGGWMDSAFQYVIEKGIIDDAAYPYVAKDQACKQDGGNFKITGFTDIPKGDIEGLADAVINQPVAVAVDATLWSFYFGGVFSICGSSLNHGVLLVGYDAKAWYVKNSWGGSWGEKGYIRVKRGNTCGIADSSSYPK